jgi:hypothetical protein
MDAIFPQSSNGGREEVNMVLSKERLKSYSENKFLWF